MQPVATPPKLGYKEFCELPDDGQRYEIIDGELFVSPSPRTIHQRVLLRLAKILMDHVEDGVLGEIFVAPYDVLLAEHDIVEPDIIFVSSRQSHVVTDLHIRGVPDLLIEVLSALRPQMDTEKKRAAYARCGVAWYWIVDPQRKQVSELQLVSGDYQIRAEPGEDAQFAPALFPGLQIPLARLWK